METEKISAVVPNEKELEDIITQLLSESVARSDISVQGDAEKLKDKYGVSFVKPKVILDSSYPPTQEPYMRDDFGWVIGFSFALPLFICLILGIFIVGDIRSNSDIFLYGFLSALLGTMIGLAIAVPVKKNHDKRIRKQEKKGGFVMWVITHSKQQTQQVKEIFKNHHIKSIQV